MTDPGSAIEAAQKATAEFWQKFFNEKDMQSFNEFVADDYIENGTPGASGSGLKKWIQGVFKEYDLDVTVDESLGAEMPVTVAGGSAPTNMVTVSVSWTAHGVPKDPGGLPFLTKGMNVLFFNSAGKVEQNWHCQQVVAR